MTGKFKVKLSQHSRKIVIIVSLICVVIEIVFLILMYNTYVKTENDKAIINGEGIAGIIQSQLNRYVDDIILMEELYVVYGEDYLADFRLMCNELYKDNLAIGSLYFAPDGVIKYSYPDEIDESTKNYEMLKDPVQGPKALKAVEDKIPTIAGPHSLIEGGTGFIIRNPIYIDGEFKAFIIIVIDKEQFVESVIQNLSAEEKNYNFAVFKENDETAVTDDNGSIFSNTDKKINSNLKIKVYAPNDIWYMEIEATDESNLWGKMLPELVISLASMILIIISIYLNLKNNEMDRIVELDEQKEYARKELDKRYRILETMSRNYLDMYVIEPDKNQSTNLKRNGVMLDEEHIIVSSYNENWDKIIDNFVVSEAEKIRMRKLIAIEYIKDILSKQEEFSFRFELENKGKHIFEAKYAKIIGGDDLEGSTVLGIRNIDDVVLEEKRQLETEKAHQEALETALKKAEEANRAKTAFLFNMSHDIRTPMNAIIGFTDLLDKNITDIEKSRDYIKKIKDSNNFLLSLINNVLEMSRIESGKIILDENYCNIYEFCESISSVFLQKMKDKNIDFDISIDVEDENFYCDETKLREIILNILSNSVKYTNEFGKICVVITEERDKNTNIGHYKTVIKDSGIGMAKEYLPHIFEEFSREKTSTESKVIGTGLGMSIVKKLVELMEGVIEVESELGVGSSFTVKLPLKVNDVKEQQKSDIKNSDSAIDLKELSGRRILMAEDNELNAEIAKAVLMEAGFVVEHVMDGLECVEALKQAEGDYYDLILMDIQMPNMDGYSATRVIRALGDIKKASIPIVAITANAFEEDKKNAFDVGMNGHISKPINVPELIKLLYQIIKKQ